MSKIKSCRIVVLILIVILCISSFPNLVSAHQDSLNVIMTCENQDKVFSSGDSAKVTVHVFDKGSYVDADNKPTLSVNQYSSGEIDTQERELGTEKTSTGKYESTLTIMDSDIENYEYLELELKDTEKTSSGSRARDYGYYYSHYDDEYAVGYGRDSKTDDTYNFVYSDEVNDIILNLKRKEKMEVAIEIDDCPDYPFNPGDTIDITIKVSEDGDNIAPGDFKLILGHDDTDGYETEELPYNNPSDGVYKASYTIPSRLTKCTSYSITAKAELTDDNNDETWDDTAHLSFELNFFDIWYHKISRDETETKFDIWVSDMDGKAVSNAGVYLFYEIYKTYDYEDSDHDGFSDNFEIHCKTDPNDHSSYPENIDLDDSDNDDICDKEEEFYGSDPKDRYSNPDWPEYIRNSEVKTTDNLGKAIFLIETTEDDIGIDGYVKKGELNQTFHGRISSETEEEEPTEPEPSGSGFEVLSSDNINFISLGSTTVSKQFIAFLEGEKLESADVYYYLYTAEKILTYGDVTTSTDGKFSISFTPPSKECAIHFNFETSTGDHPKPFVDYGWEDSDWDDFSDKFEDFKGTDPDDRYDYPSSIKDSDDDYYCDKFEIYLGTDPEDPSDYPCDYKDSDWDGFGDEFEISEGTDHDDDNDYPDPYKDSDSDGYSDEFETSKGTEPNNYDSYPCNYIDSDGDDYSDDFETSEGTDPEDEYDYPCDYKDSDYDGFGDDYEIYCGTNPDSYYDYPTQDPEDTTDSDGDGHYDGEEEYYGTNPDDNNDYPFNSYEVDSDWDNHCNLEEEYYGTDPNDNNDYPYNSYAVNSDSDNYCDLEEKYYKTDPDDSSDYPYKAYSIDSDWDDHTDAEEIYYGTDPNDSANHPENSVLS